jgi:hypothetical protein
MVDLAQDIGSDEFSKVFADLAKLGEGQNAPVAAAPAPEPVVEAPAAVEPAASEEVAAETPVDDVGEARADAAPAGETEDEPKADAAPSQEDVMKRFADYLERQQAQQERQAQEPAAPQAVPEPEAAPLFNQNEVETLQTFQKDWPDVAVAMQLVTRAQNQMLAEHIFKEVNAFLAPKLQLLEAVAQRTQLQDLQSAVPNYDEVRDKIVEWALSDQQPKYLRAAYEHVIKSGDVDEVRDLYRRYEQETGQSTQPKAAPAPAPVRKATELPPAAKQAAASLAPVSGRRSVQAIEPESESFEDAFSKFAAEA